jgi:hypothetical protein
MKMKFLDGLTLHESNADTVPHVITLLASGLDVPLGTIHLTDAKGAYIERAKLFEETLTDGSKAYTIELHFSS